MTPANMTADEWRMQRERMRALRQPYWFLCQCCWNDCDCGCVVDCPIHKHRREGGQPWLNSRPKRKHERRCAG